MNLEYDISHIEVGDKLKLFYSEGNPNNQLYHVRGIVDDMLVLKYWLPHKRFWRYTVEHPYFLKFNEEYITYTKGTKK